ncbi:MAG: hypothetical protein M1820_001426 [Bogoriella megaspora]|nr:MAG: hypothetical protein M1820_001426 [Bogoriella megaspora]
MSDATRLKNTVYVGGLDNAVTAQTLQDAFVPFGEIIDISLPKPDLVSSTDPHKGFGYVEFQEPGDAREAIDNMDQSELYGRVIKVAQAKPQKNLNEGLGSKKAIWEQAGWLEKHGGGEEGGTREEQDEDGVKSRPADPMQGLEGLDVAGPKPA